MAWLLRASTWDLTMTRHTALCAGIIPLTSTGSISQPCTHDTLHQICCRRPPAEVNPWLGLCLSLLPHVPFFYDSSLGQRGVKSSKRPGSSRESYAGSRLTENTGSFMSQLCPQARGKNKSVKFCNREAKEQDGVKEAGHGLQWSKLLLQVQGPSLAFYQFGYTGIPALVTESGRKCTLLLVLGQPFLNEGTRLLHEGQHLPCQSNKSHKKLRFTSGCLEHAQNLQKFKQRLRASRSRTYYTLYFNPVPQAPFFCPHCELPPATPAFWPSTCTLLPAAVHIASHNEGTAHSISLTSSRHWPYL